MANPIHLNFGITLKDIYQNLDDNQLKKLEAAQADGFTKAELAQLEQEGIDVSIIEDNSTMETPVEENAQDSQELQQKKQELKEINKKILDNSLEITNLETENIALEDEINENFRKNLEKQNDLEQEQKEEIREAQEKALEKYTSSDGEITEEEYRDNLSKELNGISQEFGSQFDKIANAILDNECKMKTLSANMKKVGDLKSNNECLKNHSETLSNEIEELSAKEAQERAQAAAAAAAAQGGDGEDVPTPEGGDGPGTTPTTAPPEAPGDSSGLAPEHELSADKASSAFWTSDAGRDLNDKQTNAALIDSGARENSAGNPSGGAKPETTTPPASE